MLLLGSDIEVSGITVFRDHVSATTFHYLPGPPRVVADAAGVHCRLQRFRGEHQGGLLTLDVDLALDEAALAAAREALGERFGGEVDLVPVLFTDGTARLTALGVEGAPAPGAEGGAATPGAETPPPGAGLGAGATPASPARLVERILGTATPSLLGRARAVFALELDREGASLLDAALRSGSAPVIVAYDLAYVGLRPARGLRARVRYGMAYDFLRARLAADTLFFRADLDREAEALGREGHIEIEDVDYQGSDPAVLARRQEEVRATLRELSEALFFRPAASPAALGASATAGQPALGTAWAARGRPRIAFVLRELAQREEQELAYDLREAAAATVRVAPQGALRLPDDADPGELIQDVTLDWPPPAVEVRALALPDADWSGVEAIHVDLRSGEELRTLVLSPAAGEERTLLPPGGLEHRLRVVAAEEPEALGAPPEPPESPSASAAAFSPLPTWTLVLDPQALARRRTLRVTLGVVDAAAVRQVHGRLAAGERTHDFLLDAAHPEHRVVVRGREPLRLTAEMATADGGAVAIAQTVGPDQTVAVVNQPADRFQTVLVTLQDPLGRYESVVVELERAAGEPRRSFALTAAAPEARWSAPRPAGAPRTFRYRARTLGRDAAVAEEGWQEGAGSLLVVGDPDLRLETVEVVAIGPPDLVGAIVRLVSLDPPAGVDPAVETMLEPGQPPFQARLPFRRGAARRYRVEGQSFLAEGEQAIGPREETAEVLLLSLGPG